MKASERLAGKIHNTPIHTSSTLDHVTGRKVFFKCENFQKTGSAKARGALNAVCSRGHLKYLSLRVGLIFLFKLLKNIIMQILSRATYRVKLFLNKM